MPESRCSACFRGCCTSDKIRLDVPRSSYILHSPIARGSESVVYEATLDGRKVAAKKPVLSTSEHLDKFHSELQLLCTLDHPGLATLVAAHAKPPDYLFFFPFYEHGNLADKIHVEEWNPSVEQVVDIAIQLAKALQYLHSLGIAHRDVKTANILLDDILRPHLSDFGLAAFKKDLKHISLENWRSSGKPTGGFHKKNMVGTLIYMAPEILRKDIHTEKSDVYSFSISINELLTGVVPYTDLRAEAQAHTVLEMNYTEQKLTVAVASEGLRPILAGSESGAPPDFLKLIQKCWDAAPQNRPTFDDIIEKLKSIMKQINNQQMEGIDPGKPPGSGSDPSDIIRHQYFEEKVNWFATGEKLFKKSSQPRFQLWNTSLNGVPSYSPVLSWGSFATCGRRETMEDTHFLLPRIWDEKDVHSFGIFDGHRGAAAAEFAARALPGFLQDLGSTSSPADALSQAFVRTDLAFRKELACHRNSKRVAQKDWHPGCTAIAALIVRDTLFVANAGDCRIILCRRGLPYALSKDHVASCPMERERVTQAGGQVKWQVDTWRVGPAALQVTRSIGDDDLKPAVTAEPEITETLLSLEDEYLVMASDGLWDVITIEEVVLIIKDTVKEPGMCSKRLAMEAAERGSKDNITVIIVFLRPVSTAERIY